jgi:hypothetical protein
MNGWMNELINSLNETFAAQTEHVGKNRKQHESSGI